MKPKRMLRIDYHQAQLLATKYVVVIESACNGSNRPHALHNLFSAPTFKPALHVHRTSDNATGSCLGDITVIASHLVKRSWGSDRKKKK